MRAMPASRFGRTASRNETLVLVVREEDRVGSYGSFRISIHLIDRPGGRGVPQDSWPVPCREGCPRAVTLASRRTRRKSPMPTSKGSTLRRTCQVVLELRQLVSYESAIPMTLVVSGSSAPRLTPYSKTAGCSTNEGPGCLTRPRPTRAAVKGRDPTRLPLRVPDST